MRRSGLHTAALVACALVACDSSDDATTTSPASEPSGGKTTADAGKARDAATTPRGTLDGRVAVLPPSANLACEPGSYRGDFTCQIDGILPWGGQIAFDLVEERMDGADVVILEIKAGTKLVGMDTMNGTFGGDLDGMFDCGSGELTGMLQNGYYDGNLGFMVHLAGGLSGMYGVGDGGTPGFTGVMGPLTNPDWGAVSPSAMCTWSASRIGDADADAGTP